MKTQKNEHNRWVKKKKYFSWKQIIAYVLYPFWMFGKYIIRLSSILFFEKIRLGDNGIIGPGYRVHWQTRFSWGKTSFILLAIILVLVLILYFYR